MCEMPKQNSTTVIFWLSVLCVLVQLNFAGAKECGTLLIRHNLSAFSALTNCTTILGSLTIESIKYNYSMEEINKLSFPQLKEITGFFAMFFVPGLNSIGSLFPNLTVIRGQDLVLSYSLMIFQLPQLTDIGLKSLISIQQGYVLILSCPALCYHNTIDWEKITDELEEDIGAEKGNIIQQYVPEKCPTKESCRSCTNRSCWSSHKCQKFDSEYNSNGTIKCHQLCLGGCVNETAAGCNLCYGLTMNDTCIEKCPNDLFKLPETMRCVSAETCKRYGLLAFQGECLKNCPTGYSSQDPDSKEIKPFECFKCKLKCPQHCRGGKINNAADLDHFRGCTIVVGPLHIQLELNMTDIREKLEESLGSIDEIHGVLRIRRSFILTSLSFFRNLNFINATMTNVTMTNVTMTNVTMTNVTMTNVTMANETKPVQINYALEVTENDNLQTLFNSKEKINFKMIGGGMLFHFNSKLCLEEIHNFQGIAEYNSTHDSIGYDTNGYDEACHAKGIYTFVIVVNHTTAKIYWNITNLGENKRLIGYYVYYMESPPKEVTYFSGVDACSPNSWQSIFVPYDNLQQEEGLYKMVLQKLKQYTTYAYYVRTHISLKDVDQVLNVTQGQSQLKWFKTLPDRPKPPIVRTRDKTNTTLTLEWNPSTPENQLIQKYFIDVYVQVDDLDEIDKRDYCRNPLEYTDEDIKSPKLREVICCDDPRAYLEYFRREKDQDCGHSDPSCKSTYESVLFHRQVENILNMANAQRPPSEQYKTQIESHESPKDYDGSTKPFRRKPDHSRDHDKFYLHSHIISDGNAESVIVPNLKAFNMYAFYVYACNNISNCSDYFFHFDRTEPSIYADDVGIKARVEDERGADITLFIKEPLEPNGATVSYEIEIYHYERDSTELRCITRKAMVALNYTYRFENLPQGIHWFRVRSISIAFVGRYSDSFVIEVEPLLLDTKNVIWGIALTFMVILLIIIVATSYQKCKRCSVPQLDDGEFLLAESEQSIQESPGVVEILTGDPTVKLPATQSGPSQTPLRDVPSPKPPRSIQMTVFKSNIATSPQLLADQPSTSTVTSRIPGQNTTPVTNRILRTLQPLRRGITTNPFDMDNMEGSPDEFIPEKLFRRYWDDSDCEYPLPMK